MRVYEVNLEEEVTTNHTIKIALPDNLNIDDILDEAIKEPSIETIKDSIRYSGGKILRVKKEELMESDIEVIDYREIQEGEC